MPANFSRTVRKLRLRHFEVLSLLALESTVRGVARRMALTQPAVSKMLREIEDCFGTQLFLRSPTGLDATAAGLRLVRHATVLMNELRAAGEETDAIVGGAAATLRVGTLSVIPRVPIAIARLRAAMPAVVVRVREAKVVDLVAGLRDGALDCIVGALPPEMLQTAAVDTLDVEPLAPDRLCVVAAPRHRRVGATALRWSDLAGERWVLPPRESLLRRALIDACLRAGLDPPEPDVELLSPVSLSALLRLDATLLGVSRLEQALDEQRDGALGILRVTPVVPLPPIALITRRTAPPSEALRAFRAALVARGRRLPRRTSVAASD
jgi:DNA-binding transcriptional LysR family regulator